MRRIIFFLICITTFYCCNSNFETTYLKNGSKEEIGKTVNDVKIGKWKYYHINGIVREKGRYDSKGNKIGIWKGYNEQGKFTYIFHHGKSISSSYTNGVLQEKGKIGEGYKYLFINNELQNKNDELIKVGSWKELYVENKEKENFIPVLMACTYGLEVQYSDETGERIPVNDTIMDKYYMIYDTIVEWKHLKDGKWQYWNGFTIGETNYQKGCEYVFLKVGLKCKNSASVKTGTWKDFHEDGSLKGRGKYFPILVTYEFPRITNHSLVFGKELLENDLLTGNYFEIYDTIFVDNYLKDGMWKYWNEDKKLISKEYYDKGQLVNIKEY